jgi:cytochrome c biogenesis protein CcmG, thiol:disulfide interchange protein DsbE
VTRRALAVLATLATLVCLALTSCSSDGGERPTTMPDVTLAGFDGGEPVDLGTLRGPALVNLWASWCGPCREEMPLLEQFHRRYGDRVAVLGIDYQDQQTAKAAELVEASGVTYPLVADPDGAIDGQGAFPRLRGLPFWAVVDEQGTVTHVKAGEVTSVAEIVDMAEEHLAVTL